MVEYRWADGQYQALPELAADLVNRKVSLIAATGGSFSVRAAKMAVGESGIPILFVLGLNPVQELLVSRLEQPDKKITGIAIQTTAEALLAKRVELMRQLVPKATTFALLTNGNTVRDDQKNAAETARATVKAALMAAGLVGSEATTDACGAFCPKSAIADSDFEGIFDDLKGKGNATLIVGADAFLTDRRALIVALARKYAVPTIFPWRECVEAGGLISYGSSLTFAYREVGRYAGKILKGATVADLPVLQEGRFELAINLRTARELKIPVPRSMMASADYFVR
jgi:putative ABC transport system substrate-binding protein